MSRHSPASIGDCVFKASRFDVRRCTGNQPDGTAWRRDFVAHPGAVVILPLVDDRPGHERLALIQNERFAVGRTLHELPAGTLEPGEDPMACAERELIEETGYRAAKLAPLTEFFTSPGICDERMWAFVATELTHVGQCLEAHERITVEVVPLDGTMQRIRDGVIEDGKTLATLLYYCAFREASGRTGA